jgi:hypothetical protein
VARFLAALPRPRFAAALKSLPHRQFPRRRQAPLCGLFRVVDSIARPARLVLCISRDGREKIMETILIIVVLLFLFGGGGYYWNRRRG